MGQQTEIVLYAFFLTIQSVQINKTTTITLFAAQSHTSIWFGCPY